MKMYNNFSEIENDLITPRMKDNDFFKLVLKSDFNMFKGRLLFTKCFDYDLNPDGENFDKRGCKLFFHEYLKTKARLLSMYIDRLPADVREKKKNTIGHPGFREYLEYLSNISFEDYEKLRCICLDKSIDDSNPEKAKINFFRRMVRDNIGGDSHDFGNYVSTWHYFRSPMLAPDRKSNFNINDIKHRLYVAINFKYLNSFVNDFLFELEKMDLPYYMKMMAPSATCKYRQNDTIVIYADSAERIVQYVNIINKILEKKPQYKSAIHKPSAHLGTINDYIGYGNEFNVEKTSYSTVVGECSLSARFAALNKVKSLYGVKDGNEMMAILDKKDSRSLKISNCFKNEFWKVFREYAEDKGYSLDSICFNKDFKPKKETSIIERMDELRPDALFSPPEIFDREIAFRDELFTHPKKRVVDPLKDVLKPRDDMFTMPAPVEYNGAGIDFKKRIDEAIKRLNVRVRDIPRAKVIRSSKVGNIIQISSILDEHIDEYIPGTNIFKPRYRGVYETDEEYIEFLRKYYEAAFSNQSSDSHSRKQETNLSIQSFDELMRKAKELRERRKRELQRQQAVSNHAIEIENAARKAKLDNIEKMRAYEEKLQMLNTYTMALENECNKIESENDVILESNNANRRFIEREEDANNELLNISNEIDSIIGTSVRR